MKHEFCTSCGTKVEYNFAPPNFCSKCGNPLGSVSKATIAPPQKFEEKVEEEVVPILDKLQYDVSYQGLGANQIKFEDLATQKPTSQDRPKSAKGKKKTPTMSKEDFLVKSVQECKSVGNNSADVGGEE